MPTQTPHHEPEPKPKKKIDDSAGDEGVDDPTGITASDDDDDDDKPSSTFGEDDDVMHHNPGESMGNPSAGK